MFPTGKAGKQDINETTRLIDAWIKNSPLKRIVFKAIMMIMPNLSLQKPSKTSKSNDYSLAHKTLLLWKSGNIYLMKAEIQQT